LALVASAIETAAVEFSMKSTGVDVSMSAGGGEASLDGRTCKDALYDWT